jgi:hypothetical protein
VENNHLPLAENFKYTRINAGGYSTVMEADTISY